MEKSRGFSERLDWTMIDMALLDQINKTKRKYFDVIVEVNLLYPEGREVARQKARELLQQVLEESPHGKKCGIRELKTRYSSRYFFARLHVDQIRELTSDQKWILVGKQARPIYKIWLDEAIEGFLTESVRAIKADAAQAAFSAAGRYVTWAVVDSGIWGDHEHFKEFRNLEVDPPVQHADFSGDGGLNSTGAEPDDADIPGFPQGDALKDPYGHGTHVAGIIAGGTKNPVYSSRRVRDENDSPTYLAKRLNSGIQGVAPQCRLVSLRVLDSRGHGKVSNIIAALGFIQQINNHGRWLHIHGVNLSVGYEFDAESYGCGQSPLCVEVDRVARSGVVVVAAAGNTGYGKVAASGWSRGFRTSLDVTINDPGNAEQAITVGATHREKPHMFGVSYFSSRGPTADGRLKPDLVAPGEKIMSCAAGSMRRKVEEKVCDYREESGTSMAAPHVSGCIAAFLSIRNEFIGQSEKVKEIFLSTATDLGRERYFQGHGLVDLMRAIQSV